MGLTLMIKTAIQPFATFGPQRTVGSYAFKHNNTLKEWLAVLNVTPFLDQV